MSTHTQTTTRYMYIMSVVASGRHFTATGTVDVQSGTSRFAVLTHIVENNIKRELGLQDFSILYFNLELDVL
ncbi:hypothetical protein HII36_51420 [Nonomuraea sp. NN258]|uniref:hypothetical protein n=1 Tax=Nonomuraea antri TaxID=2730852 RepID=UPI001567E0BD|nr:hypothetical protein [Nonomuraea antri]NRQ40180.1 hypothetical protein [Nonomuraea antri]